ncbi:MAG: class I SAM-dependent methyltransferase [Bellilinea sp.]|jgi:predicted TPR repeat methyltransferase
MVSAHDKYADEYDGQIKNYDCYIADVLFGLSYEYTKKGDTILDMGIGTGISSRLFYLAGLQVYGIDGSSEMLNICKTKGIAKELIKQDVLVFPWPYQDDMFNHIISCGVFHFIGNLDKLFDEISRVHKNDGIFAFTVMEGKDDQRNREKYQNRIEDGLNIFSHKASYIYKLLKNNCYSKEKEIVSFVGQTQFRVIVARKGKA